MLDPAWTVMDMDMASSMLLLLDHSVTVTFKDVAQFSAAIYVSMTLDSFDIFFAGEFMSRFADIGTDTSLPRLLKLLMVEHVFTMYGRTRKVIRSVHVVVAVEKNGMKLYVSWEGAFSFVNYF